MATIFRIGVFKFSCSKVSARLCKKPKTHNVTQVAFMTRKAYQSFDAIRPEPFPYWRKSYTLYHQIMDPVMYRFHENSKLVVIDGPPASGKAALGEEIADQFGMLYMPAPTHDEYYINQYGFDVRTLDPKLPEHIQSFDLPKFLAKPTDPKATWFQFMYFQMRHEQYINAMLHILSTGQGVVMDRCVLSDIAFAQAMVDAGYISKKSMEYYETMRATAQKQILRPNLIIYLDVPVDTVKNNIKRRGIPHEVNSEVYTTKYLSDLESAYKDRYLNPLIDHSHLLIYDWSKKCDIINIVEDIEELDFDSHDDTNGKMGDWIFPTVADICDKRLKYEDKQQLSVELMRFEDMDIPRELYYTGEEQILLDEALKGEPSEQYKPGYNPNFGDKVLWKQNIFDTFTIRRTPRDFINRDKFMT